jgi:ParB-like chromosome segregation protein Spo0J
VKMRIERVAIERLKPPPYNPRKELQPGSRGWKKLERSLREFDLVQPIVWNERTGHIVGGHQRVAILRHRGETEVDVAVVSLNPTKERALNVALNNSQVGGDWDLDKLRDLVGGLTALPEFDVTLLGFDERELRELSLGPVTLGETLPPLDVGTIRVIVEVNDAEWERVRALLDPLVEAGVVRTHVGRGNGECQND